MRKKEFSSSSQQKKENTGGGGRGPKELTTARGTLEGGAIRLFTTLFTHLFFILFMFTHI